MSKRVTELWIYPIKSMGGMRVPSARVFTKGLEHDRRWMLITEDNRFMTQRDFPWMALFKLSAEAGGFRISYTGQSVELPFSHENKLITASVWDDLVEVYEVSAKHSEWISALGGIKCRLVVFPEDKSRKVDPLFSPADSQVSLADSHPLLIIGQQSLDDLNKRLQSPVPMNRFRPNIIFSGDEPFEEDNWRNFRVGQNKFAVVKPCARCVVTTIDQETGTKGTEPLTTLASYRRQNNKVFFGQNLVPLDYHSIEEGDEIVLE